MDPKKYLEGLGITSTNTVLVAFIDGQVRNPDIGVLLENYATLKLRELELKILPNGGLGDPIQSDASVTAQVVESDIK